MVICQKVSVQSESHSQLTPPRAFVSKVWRERSSLCQNSSQANALEMAVGEMR